MRIMIYWSKLAAGAGLELLFVLQCLPPNTLSAKAGDKANDKVRDVDNSARTVELVLLYRAYMPPH